MQYNKLLPLIGIVIFVYILFKIGISKIIQTLSGVKLEFILLALVLFIPITYMQTIKWKLILDKQGIHKNTWYLCKLTLISMYYGSITPSRLGTFTKAWYLKDDSDRTTGECFSSVVIEKIFDIISILILAVFGSFLLINKVYNIFWHLVLILLFIIFSFLFFLNKNRSKHFLKVIQKIFVPKRFRHYTSNAFHDFYRGVIKKRYLIIPAILSFFVWIVIYFQAYIVGKGFGVNNVPPLYFITLFPIATMVGLIPITISGLGTREAALITLFGFFNIPAEKIVSMSLVWVFISMIAYLITGFIFVIKKIKFNKI